MHQLRRILLIFGVALHHILFYFKIIPFIYQTIKGNYISKDFEKNISYGSKKHQKLDLYRSKSGNQSPVVVFIYGGAWNTGDKGYYYNFGKELSSHGIVTVIPNYLLYPKGRVEDMIQDLSSVFAWLGDYIDSIGGDKERVWLIGHSAGAHLGCQFLIKNSIFHSIPSTMEDSYSKCDFHQHAQLQIAGFIGLCGVYDIAEHYLFESAREYLWNETCYEWH
eukprot:TRINITY_DN12495_c0_g1_i1.p1 TRINITY_DN12495_c0_g1~~TRINITY_DN12495_c0_g1_i1.p1  ORF type:complete len:221 (+),score=47.16 TRINITY_DN12495_c0_g1_i1:12-674(+)